MPRDIFRGVLTTGVVRTVIDEGNRHCPPEVVDERHPRRCTTTGRCSERSIASYADLVSLAEPTLDTVRPPADSSHKARNLAVAPSVAVGV